MRKTTNWNRANNSTNVGYVGKRNKRMNKPSDVPFRSVGKYTLAHTRTRKCFYASHSSQKRKTINPRTYLFLQKTIGLFLAYGSAPCEILRPVSGDIDSFTYVCWVGEGRWVVCSPLFSIVSSFKKLKLVSFMFQFNLEGFLFWLHQSKLPWWFRIQHDPPVELNPLVCLDDGGR